MDNSKGAKVAELSKQSKTDWLKPVRWGADGPVISPMDQLWNRFDGMYPNRWRAAFANEQAIQNWRDAWSIAFAEEGIAPAELGKGLAACRRLYDWPPSLTEFMKACRPPIDQEVAFDEACKMMAIRYDKVPGREEWSHPAIFWAAHEFGSFELKRTTYDKAKTRWRHCFDKAMADFSKGGDRAVIPPKREELPKPVTIPLTEEERAEKMAKLKAAAGIFTPVAEAPPPSWEDRRAALEKIDRELERRGEK